MCVDASDFKVKCLHMRHASHALLKVSAQRAMPASVGSAICRLRQRGLLLVEHNADDSAGKNTSDGRAPGQRNRLTDADRVTLCGAWRFKSSPAILAIAGLLA